MLESPQYATTLDQILGNPKTRRLFLRHLQGNELLVYANFWLDVHTLCLCTEHLRREDDVQVPQNRSSNEHPVIDNTEKENYKDRPMNLNICDDANGNSNSSILSNCDKKDTFIAKVSNQEGSYCDNLSDLTGKLIVPDRLNNNPPDIISSFSSSSCNSVDNTSCFNADQSISSTDDSTISSLKQYFTKEIWRIFKCYIAVDAENPCPFDSSVTSKIFETIKKLHISLNVDCFLEAQNEAFRHLQV